MVGQGVEEAQRCHGNTRLGGRASWENIPLPKCHPRFGTWVKRRGSLRGWWGMVGGGDNYNLLRGSSHLLLSSFSAPYGREGGKRKPNHSNFIAVISPYRNRCVDLFNYPH